MAIEPHPSVEHIFQTIIGRPISESSAADADRFVAIMESRSQVERNKAASYTSATDIVRAAKREMDECGCPYDLPDSGTQLSRARRIRVVHQPQCPRQHG